MYPPGRHSPQQVLDVLIKLFNTRYTALSKSVSHKTRFERAQFLRRFFRDLHFKAGYPIPPDPRNLGQRHIRAMVHVWRTEALAPATIQTYLSFLRGLASWLGKPGLVRQPGAYGLRPEEVERHESAQRDKSWSGNGIVAEALLASASAMDVRAGASMRLMLAFGLRRKESVMCEPHAHVFPFAETGLAAEAQAADDYLWVCGKGGRERWLAIESLAQREALDQARAVVSRHDESLGAPDKSLKSNLWRLDYVRRSVGRTRRKRGATGHGARHQHLQETLEAETGVPAPVRGGQCLDAAADRAARLKVSAVAGHARLRAAAAYLGRSAAKSGKACVGQAERPPSNLDVDKPSSQAADDSKAQDGTRSKRSTCSARPVISARSPSIQKESLPCPSSPLHPARREGSGRRNW